MFSSFGNFFGNDGSPSRFFGSRTRFSCEPKCFSMSFHGREELEFGNRILMPATALEKLKDTQAPTPWLFEVADLDGRRWTHAGVLEFSAPAETCYMPYWMLQQLQAQEGDVMRLTLKELPKATYALFRPASVALHRVYNPRALLENGLRGFATLTSGDNFAVAYDGHQYGIEVLEVRPGDAACIVDTDMEVDFATAKDAQAAASRANSRQDEGDSVPSSPKVFPGAGKRIDGTATGEPSEADEPYDPMPWKNRIPKGVKQTEPPYGIDVSKLFGFTPGAASSTASGTLGIDVAAAAARQRGAESFEAALASEEARRKVLCAAQDRYDQNIEEIERRRQEEEQKKLEELARLENEEKCKKEREEAKRKWKIEQAAPRAPKHQAKDVKKSGPFSVARKFLFCCVCFRSSSSRGNGGGHPDSSGSRV